MTSERGGRTFICSVLFLDIVEYSRKPVAEQIGLKDRFNSMIASAIREIPRADRIILDTGDGVAINFLGDPEDALFVAMSLRDAFAPDPGKAPEVPARIGINLGPVRLVRDLNSQPNIIGDGVNVAQRVMGFASAGQILVSRSYYEVVSHISEDYSKLFSYEGPRTDKHVREHEVYSVGYSTSEAALRSSSRKAREQSNRSAEGGRATSPAMARLQGHIERWLGNRSLAYGTAAFSALTLLLAILSSFSGTVPQEQAQAAATPPANRLVVAAVEEPEALATGETRAPATQGRQSAPIGERNANGRAAESQQPAARQPSRAPTPATNRATSSEAAPGKRKESPTGGVASAPTVRERAEAGTNNEQALTDSARPRAQPGTWTTARAQPAATEPAIVTLAISPWGEVYIDGKHIGVSPPVNEVRVRPGRRSIEIRNGNFPPYTQRVELKSRQKIKVRYKFN